MIKLLYFKLHTNIISKRGIFCFLKRKYFILTKFSYIYNNRYFEKNGEIRTTEASSDTQIGRKIGGGKKISCKKSIQPGF